MLQFNAHEVAQFEMVTKTSQEGAKSAFIGAAVYPTLALFNHRYIFVQPQVYLGGQRVDLVPSFKHIQIYEL